VIVLNSTQKIGRMRAGIATTGCVVLLGAAYLGTIGGSADERFHLPAAGWLIETTGLESRYLNNLRILSSVEFEKSFSQQETWLQRPTLSKDQWKRVLRALSSASLSKVFVIEPLSDVPLSVSEVQSSYSRMVFASFPSTKDSEPGAFSLGNLVQNDATGTETRFLRGIAGSVSQNIVYGHLGPWSPYSFVPFMKTDASGEFSLSKHIGISGLPGLRLEEVGATDKLANSKILISGKSLYLGPSGDLHSLPLGDNVVRSMSSSLQDFAKDPRTFLQSLTGNEVVIVQGRKIWSDSPSLEAEIAAIAGVVHSRLTGKWISETWGASLYLALLSIVTILGGFILSPRRLLGFALVGLAGQVLLLPFLLAVENLLIPWAPIAFVLLPASLAGSFIGARFLATTNGLVKANLSPAFSHDDATQIAQDFESEGFTTRECLATLLDLNVVGFSTTVENTLPQETTHLLNSFLNPLIEIVHSHGGFLSELSPDRMVAVFGHGITRRDASRDQVTKALQCACEIQKKSVELIHAYGAGVMPPFPVRCGINSSMIRIGALEIAGKFDLKAVGAGVEVARKLAVDCQPFRILLSTSSVEILQSETESKLQRWALENFTRVDDSRCNGEAFEVDPFEEDREGLAAATDLYRSYNQIKREDNRFAFPRGAAPILNGSVEGESFDLLDFSLTGLRLRSSRYLKIGATLEMTPAEFSEGSSPLLLMAAVHWAAPEVSLPSGRESYILGVRFINMTTQQLETVAHYLHGKLAAARKGVVVPVTAIEENDWAS
jgi:class 3 adenylate cyclase